MAGSRRSGRERGKSDSIDSIAVARAALREGLDELPAARWKGPSSICGCWSITASGWSVSASGSTTRCSGICTISGPSSSCPAARCSRASGAPGSAGAWRAPSKRYASGSLATSCAACANSPRRSRRSSSRSPGSSPARAAAALRAGVRAADRGQARRRDRRRRRFSSDAKLARAAGVAPIPVSSGKTNRHRLDRGGNRQINAAIHRIAVTRARCHPETRTTSPASTPKARPPRSHPLPQTPPRPPHLAPPPAAPTRPRNTTSPSIS